MSELTRSAPRISYHARQLITRNWSRRVQPPPKLGGNQCFVSRIYLFGSVAAPLLLVPPLTKVRRSLKANCECEDVEETIESFGPNQHTEGGDDNAPTTGGSAAVRRELATSNSAVSLVAAVGCAALLHPLDLIKTRMQVRGIAGAAMQTVGRGSVQSGFRIWRVEGIRGLYKGCAATIVGGGVSWGLFRYLLPRLFLPPQLRLVSPPCTVPARRPTTEQLY
eukprot:Selendium_serpulae@DN5366_c0_g1_i1.p1